jgi:ketosteroid isomerase-like protein
MYFWLSMTVIRVPGKTMTNDKLPELSSKDEIEIQALIERWSKAVREENRAGIRADHDTEMLMFDVPPPFLSRGLDAYMATWEKFLSCSEKPVAFDFHDVKITAGEDVAFPTVIGRCAGVDPKGTREELEFRLTMCLRKIDGRWRVLTSTIHCRQSNVVCCRASPLRRAVGFCLRPGIGNSLCVRRGATR